MQTTAEDDEISESWLETKVNVCLGEECKRASVASYTMTSTQSIVHVRPRNSTVALPQFHTSLLNRRTRDAGTL
jgi:hypothetical protein